MSLFNCKHCGKQFDNKRKLAGHSTWCDLNPKKSDNLNKLDDARKNVDTSKLFEEIEKPCKWCGEVIKGLLAIHLNHIRWCSKNPDAESILEKAKANLAFARSFHPCQKLDEEAINKMKASLRAAHKRGAYKQSYLDRIGKPGHKLSEETKKVLSEKRKKFLSENPDKHPWKKNDKFKSVPCEFLKDKLKQNGFEFIPEYTPLQTRAFSIDIAFPEIKLGIEVNGNQHYNKDGTLKTYYQNRHDLIQADGWKLLELHYSSIYKEDLFDRIYMFALSN